MRIRRIDLTRYGCFTDEDIDFPSHKPDLHVIVGRNEAGKSTVMSAVEDLLFGIPMRSPMGFLHSYKDMRIGGTLESNGSSLAVQRRKGRKKTLLAADGVAFPAGDSALAPFLGDANRDRLQRMFSLDHARLRKGGQEILEARGDVGEALFAARSGFQDLSRRRLELDREADGLWSKRRSAKRRFYVADDRRKAAEADLRAHRLTARKWNELKSKEETCRAEYEGLRSRLEAGEADLRRLGRTRRLKRFVNEKTALDAEIERLGTTPELPADASRTLSNSEQDIRVAVRQIEMLDEEIRRAKTERKELRWDQSALLRSSEIDRIYERWIQVQKERSDLPKREAEMEAEERRLREHAGELDWSDERASDLLARIPARSAVNRARHLLNRRTSRLAEIRSTRKALREAESRLAEGRRRLDQTPVPADVRGLSAVTAATKRDFGDIGSQVREAATDLARAQDEVRHLFGLLRPRPESAEVARTLAAPTKAEVQVHRDTRKELSHRLADCTERLDSERSNLVHLRSRRDRIRTNDRPVSRKDVLDLRETRDFGWDLIRRKHIAGQPVAEEESRRFTGGAAELADAYEDAVRAADGAADRSVETASQAARLEQVSQSMEDAHQTLGTLEDEHRRLSASSEALDRAWREMWADAPITPLSPDLMLAWLETRDSLRQAIARESQIEQKLAMLRKLEERATESVSAELRLLGIDPAPMGARGLPALLDLASAELQRHEQARKTRADLEAVLRQEAAEVRIKREQTGRAVSAEKEWQGKWSTAARGLGLPPDSDPESGGAQLGVIDEMRLVRNEIANLRDKRILLMRRDIEDFERDLRNVVRSVAPDLTTMGPDEVVPKLRGRLERSRQTRKDAMAKDSEIRKLERRLNRQIEARRNAQEGIIALQALAGVETVDGLKLEIEKAERAGTCRSRLSEVIRTLERDGDGLSVAEIQDECRGVDLDKAASREEELRIEIEELRKRQLVARDSLREAETRFAAVGGSDAAAVAEGARQDALAEIGGIAAQYVRARATSLLLRWAIERNRRERQGPMLKRAGELFSELTLRSFQTLELDFDEKDQTRLVGRRPGGERVEVNGMSSGAADQLYLALRVAALEHYLEGAQPLPFIADDLLINFDDQRSGAGFRVLAELARTCQVIYFTHHEHLAEVASLAVPPSVRIAHL